MRPVLPLLLATALPLAAADEFTMTEEELFSGPSVVDASGLERGSVASNLDRESVSFSGLIRSTSSWRLRRDWFDGPSSWADNPLATALLAEAYLDVRLRKGVKAFVDLGVLYSPDPVPNLKVLTELTQGPTGVGERRRVFREDLRTVLVFKEFFLDANILRTVYLRAGKQVLQWGRGYFWNPTDLLNIEAKTFLDMDRNREGTYGLKTHIPFGTAVNLYGFADLKDAQRPDRTAGAAKLEVLLGRTELALSAWAKKGFRPVYGFDLSSRLLGFDLWAELATSEGANRPRVRLQETTTFLGPVRTFVEERTADQVFEASLGLGRAFDIVTPERLRVILEAYWNSDGYDRPMFGARDSAGRTFADYGYYRPAACNRFYSAAFLTFAKFFHQDLTASASALANWDDLSATLSLGLNWNPVYNFTVALSVAGLVGKPDSEFGHADHAVIPRLDLTVVF